MNSRIFFAALTILTALASAHARPEPTLIEVFHQILNDPEYTSLHEQEQVLVLKTIYSMLETIYRKHTQVERFDPNNGLIDLDSQGKISRQIMTN
jgi:hypothetical protein